MQVDYMYQILAYGDKPPIKGAWSESRDLFKFWEISDVGNGARQRHNCNGKLM